MTQDYFHFENEADLRKHLGRFLGDIASPYERACRLLELADIRASKTRQIADYDPARLLPTFTKPASKAASDAYARLWTPERIARWKQARHVAKIAALAAVEDSRQVKDARTLAARMRLKGSARDLAKAVAARIECECAAWDEAYGRAMPKEFWSR